MAGGAENDAAGSKVFRVLILVLIQFSSLRSWQKCFVGWGLGGSFLGKEKGLDFCCWPGGIEKWRTGKR